MKTLYSNHPLPEGLKVITKDAATLAKNGCTYPSVLNSEFFHSAENRKPDTLGIVVGLSHAGPIGTYSVILAGDDKPTPFDRSELEIAEKHEILPPPAV